MVENEQDRRGNNGNKTVQFKKKFVTYVRPLKMNTSPQNDAVPRKETRSERERLADLASTWGFGIAEVTGDGNCLFAAVALQLQQIMALNEDKQSLLMSHLQEQVGIDISSSIVDIGNILRQKVVQELKGPPVDFYQSFLPDDVNIFLEADRFRFGNIFRSSRRSNTSSNCKRYTNTFVCVKSKLFDSCDDISRKYGACLRSRLPGV